MWNNWAKIPRRVCFLENIACSNGDFQCDGYHCIPAAWKCDSELDCKDGKDEKNCGKCDKFQCNDGGCVESSFQCDGVADCRDKSDEIDCGKQYFLLSTT